jgi:sigma-B regulation protein RsbU (phosphoserine phosphatase)
VSRATNGREALEIVAGAACDLVLLDVLMPELDGETTLERLKADVRTRDLPVIMVSAVDDLDRVVRCIEKGAEDYLPKPFDPALLAARVGATLERKALRDRERQAHDALVRSQKQLATELADAADYVESLLPRPIEGPISTEWRFIPSASLGGDAFGYHPIGDDHLAIYLLDVSGHGVGTALFSASALNVVRLHGLPETDFRDPGQVVGALNRMFQMETQNNLYFTIWYGVYQRSTRRLAYASGGHPPAVLVPPGGPASTLASEGMTPGILAEFTYTSSHAVVPPGSRLFVFSDGAFEIQQGDGEMWSFDEFVEHQAQPSDPGVGDLDRLVDFARNLHGRPDFDDDLSVLRVRFE